MSNSHNQHSAVPAIRERVALFQRIHQALLASADLSLGQKDEFLKATASLPGIPDARANGIATRAANKIMFLITKVVEGQRRATIIESLGNDVSLLQGRANGLERSNGVTRPARGRIVSELSVDALDKIELAPKTLHPWEPNALKVLASVETAVERWLELTAAPTRDGGPELTASERAQVRQGAAEELATVEAGLDRLGAVHEAMTPWSDMHPATTTRDEALAAWASARKTVADIEAQWQQTHSLSERDLTRIEIAIGKVDGALPTNRDAGREI